MKSCVKKHLIAVAVITAISAASQTALAAITCTGISASSVSGTTPAGGNLDLQGSINFNCTRLLGDAITQVVFIGLNAGENPDGTGGADREMTRQTSTQQINYSIFRNATYRGGWTEAAGFAPNASNAAGGLQPTITFSSAGTTSQNFSFPYYLRVTRANYNAASRPAGIYDDLAIMATLRLNNSTGAVQSSTNFGVTMSKPTHCYFSSPPGNLTMSYTAFSSTASTGSTSFGVSCTASTTYTMALNATTGVLLGLNYSLALSATGTQTGTGFQQTYNVNGTIPAGQAGTCATGSCTGTQARTITITY